MAAVYNNMIKELIIQSELNSKLLNDVNNCFYSDTTDLTAIKTKHLDRVEAAYGILNQIPIYPYFDGTNLINSLFSFVVVPIEYLTGKYRNEIKNIYRLVDNLFRANNLIAFNTCRSIIERLVYEEKIVNTYTSQINVYDFFKHIRDALCHSGNGQIHFFPSETNGRDITHLYFYDEDLPTEKAPNKRPKVFCAKISIVELFNLIHAFNDIIFSIIADANRPYSIEEIDYRLKVYANKHLPV